MKWSCKFCNFVTYNERTIVSLYKDNHGRGRQGLSCIYPNCLAVLKSHMDVAKHMKEHKTSYPVAKLRCELCTFSAPTKIKQYFLHLKRHLTSLETVSCPFAGRPTTHHRAHLPMAHERQIRAEFTRIVTTDLLQSFLDGLDGLVLRLLEVYKAATKSGKKQPLKDILDCLAKDDTTERRRAAALLGLPRYISGEDPSTVIRMCDAHADILDDAMKGMQVGLLIACEGSELGAIPHEVFDVAVVVEETIVLHNIKDVTLGFAMLMGVIYCINLKYPNDMKYSFEFLQSGDEDQTRPHLEYMV